MTSARILELTINWNRSILINDGIDDDLLRRLTPEILRLRAESNDPITVGIDSPGGSLSSLDVLIGLLSGPNQDGNRCKLITVATHRAYSAAASLLAFGDYAVAYSHSKILYHDVRYGALEDVTPEIARTTARELQDANDHFSLKLARQIVGRLIWTYIDLSPQFASISKLYRQRHGRYQDMVSNYILVPGIDSVDIASFAVALFATLSRQNESLITGVMRRLEKWITTNNVGRSIPAYRQKGSKTPGLLDGAYYLYKKLLKQLPAATDGFHSIESNLNMFIGLLVSRLAESKNMDRMNFDGVLDPVLREYVMIQSMNERKHLRTVTELMLQHDHIFFKRQINQELEGKTEAERDTILSPVLPHATLFWYFCVLLCRELFEGEHHLTPGDAQLLGLVSEVAGGGPIQSLREYRVAREKAESEKSTE
ncbi:MAG: ATP-dependent Clp protease proteolytic subunit [Proteobacteria bacterium]|nr:ATP-dependent Clp protease proteolytic subunit [Pseudomonadota bacterium]